MNKKELIERIKNMPFSYIWDEPYLNKEIVLDLVKQLDEPQKVVVPQFVADWIDCTKNFGWDLQDAINSKGDRDFRNWFYSKNNIETFARAWLDGYKVEVEPEKEKRYLVKAKGLCGNHETLNCEKQSKDWLFSSQEENSAYKTKHTRKQLEEAGFGWVFDCPGFQIEEVEE